MTERIKIDPSSLPALKDLHRASAGIGVVTALLVVMVVLPAERGIDPTGVGGMLGLTALGDIKEGADADAHEPEVAADVATPTADVATPSPEPSFRTDELSVTIAPKKGTEVKAVMRAGDQLVYSWEAVGGRVFYDFHGEPEGAAPDVFTSFDKGTKGASAGDFEAPFDGVHGWYWQNVGIEPVTVTLKTTGVYSKIAEKH